MKFYDCTTAPSPARVRMFIAEKGLDIETVQVNLREREHLSESFLNINPFGTVPVLALDDGTVLNSTAGCRAYLEAMYPTPALLGGTDSAKGAVADWVWRIENDAFMAVAECLRNSAKGMRGRALTGKEDYAQIPQLAERGRKRALAFMDVLEQTIAGRAFVVGDDFSAADIDAYLFVEFAKWIKIEVPQQCDNTRRWYTNIAARDSAKV